MAWPYKIVNGVEVQFVRNYFTLFPFLFPLTHPLFLDLVEPSRTFRLHSVPPSPPSQDSSREPFTSSLGSNCQSGIVRSQAHEQTRLLFDRGSE